LMKGGLFPVKVCKFKVGNEAKAGTSLFLLVY